MTNGNGTGVDLTGPLAGMWRDVYRKAGAVADARAQELLKYHVYTYPHGAGGEGGGGGGNWVLLEERVLSAATAAITFDPLPTDYRDLRFVLDGHSAETSVSRSEVALRFNGDTAATSYRSTRHYANLGSSGNHGVDGANAGSEQRDSYADVGWVGTPQAWDDPDTTSVLDLLVYNYRLTGRYKRFVATCSSTTDYTYGAWLHHASGEWRSTAAIASATLSLVGGPNWAAGTRVRAYGWLDVPAGGGGGGADVTITTDASLTATESPPNTFALAAQLSPDAGNALALHANGLYATDTGGGGGTGNTTMYTQTGTPTGATNSLWFNPSESA